MTHTTDQIVVLGASNVANGLPTVINMARRLCAGPARILLACGFGRSYGNWSSVLGRQLPGIVKCGLWDQLDGAPSSGVKALITDVGNDILYGADASRISSWVETCIKRLRRLDAKVVVTELPLDSIIKLSPPFYLLMRTMLFPRCRLSLTETLETARELTARIRDVGREHGVEMVKPNVNWYGLDPIHIRSRHRNVAWRTIFSSFGNLRGGLPPGSRIPWLLRPERRRLFGIEQRRCQPCARIADGSSIYLF